MRRERSKKGNERTNAAPASSTSSVSRNAQPRFATVEARMHERAARRRLDIQGGGRGWVASPLSPALTSAPSRHPAWNGREPPHILVSNSSVCVHARRAINGKILESRSRNPDTGPDFHGSVLRLSRIDRSALAARVLRPPPLNLSPRFSTSSCSALFPARPFPAFLLTI